MRKIFRFIIFLIIFICIIVTSIYHFECKKIYESDSIELVLSRMYALLSFNIFFFILLFIFNLKHYSYIFAIVIVLGILLWIFDYLKQFIEISSLVDALDDFIDFMLFSTFNIVSPGLIIITIYYIKKVSSKYKGANLFGKYHLHEGLFGLFLMIIAIILLILRSLMIPHRIFWRQLRLVLAIVVVFAFLFSYFGSFFIFRDWKDVIRFKFIEKTKILNDKERGLSDNSVFDQISKEDLDFFKIPRLLLYPFGIFLTSFSFTMVTYGTNFIPEDFFLLNYESIVALGYFVGFVAGGLIGIDWLRIFRKFYPELYRELNTLMKKLKYT